MGLYVGWLAQEPVTRPLPLTAVIPSPANYRQSPSCVSVWKRRRSKTMRVCH